MVGGSDGTTPPPPPGTIDATSHIAASTYSLESGVQTEPTTDVGRVASGAAQGISGLVQATIDSPTAAPFASFAMANTGGWQSWETVPANMSTPVTGVHTLYLTFASGQPQDFVNVNWFTFS